MRPSGIGRAVVVVRDLISGVLRRARCVSLAGSWLARGCDISAGSTWMPLVPHAKHDAVCRRYLKVNGMCFEASKTEPPTATTLRIESKSAVTNHSAISESKRGNQESLL